MVMIAPSTAPSSTSSRSSSGCPPDVPLILDRSLSRKFKEVFDGIDDWQRDTKRNLDRSSPIRSEPSDLEDVIIDGRSLLAMYKSGKDNEDDLEELLLAAERVDAGTSARPDERTCKALRRLAADSRLGQRVEGNLQRHTHQPIHHPPCDHEPVCLRRAKPSSFRSCSTQSFPWSALASGTSIGRPLSAASASAGRSRRFRRQPEISDSGIDVRNLHQQYLTYEINRKSFTLSHPAQRTRRSSRSSPLRRAAGISGTAQAANAATPDEQPD